MTAYLFGQLVAAILVLAWAVALFVRLGTIATHLGHIRAILRTQIAPPAGFADCSASVVSALREGDAMRAAELYASEREASETKAASRILELHAALQAGPAVGRPLDCAYSIDQLRRR